MGWDSYIIYKKVRELRPADLAAVRFDVKEVYEGSPAFFAGIEPGFLFIPKVRNHAVETDLMEKHRPGVHILKFVDPHKEVLIEIKAQGYLYGFSLRRNLQAVCGDLSFIHHYSDDILELIHDDNDEALEQIARALVAPRSPGFFSYLRMAIDVGDYDPLERQDYMVNAIVSVFSVFRYLRIRIQLLGKNPMEFRPAVMDLIMAVYFAEQGKTEEARRCLAVFESDCEGYAGTVYSLYYYVYALVTEQEQGDEDEIRSHLDSAFESNSLSKRVIRKIRQFGGEAIDETADASIVPFPLSYVLMRWDPLQEKPDAVKLISLRGVLEELEDDQFVILISMGSYRSNGYYNRMMSTLGLMHRQFGQHFPRVHVVTSYQYNDDRHHEDWMLGERYARVYGSPVEVLFDPDHLICDLVGSTSAPHCVIVNKRGYVVYRGSLASEKGYWKALNTIGVEPEEGNSTSVLSSYA